MSQESTGKISRKMMGIIALWMMMIAVAVGIFQYRQYRQKQALREICRLIYVHNLTPTMTEKIITPHVIPDLVILLREDPKKEVRGGAARALRQLEDPQVVSDLLKSWRDEKDGDIRREILAALSALDRTGKDTIPILTKLLHQSSSPGWRQLAAFRLGRYGGQKGVAPPLIDGLEKEKDDSVVQSIITTLVGVGPPAVPEIIARLEQTSSEVLVLRLATILEKMGDDGKKALPQLEKWASSPSTSPAGKKKLGEVIKTLQSR